VVAGHAVLNVEKRNACMVMVGKLERKRPLERRRLLCEDNIKIDLKAIGRDDVDWINLAQDRDNWGCPKHGNEP
jgi:hypothetical protein